MPNKQQPNKDLIKILPIRCPEEKIHPLLWVPKGDKQIATPKVFEANTLGELTTYQ